MFTISQNESRVSFNPLVVSVAHAIRENGDFNDWPMLALGDLLEQEGHRQELSNHCRDQTIRHSEGYPVLAKILGPLKRLKGSETIVVNYDTPISQMLEEMNLGYRNPDINDKNFPPTEGEQGKQEKSFGLYHPNKEIQSKEVIAELKESRMRPATTREILAYGKAFPDVQREFDIIALGQTWLDGGGSRYVVYLWGNSSDCYADFYWFGDGWFASLRFLAVCE